MHLLRCPQFLIGDGQVSHGSQVLALDGEGRAPAFWRQDVSSADLATDIALLLRSDS